MAFTNACNGRHDLAWRAEPTLESIELDEGSLNSMQRTVRPRQPLNRHDFMAIDLSRKGQAAQDPLTVHMHCAGAALAVVATFLRAGQEGMLAQRVEQCRARFELKSFWLPINGELKSVAVCHDGFSIKVWRKYARPIRAGFA
ncbi:hypothetical protein AO275_08490 [Pseudomonas viridiflava]|nr:hypothetical protein AO275_08490 [Pseudomonas viridiflava]